MIASVIVHEATHARLRRCGIGYNEDERARVEAICARRKLVFAAKLPNGERVRAAAVQCLEWCAIPSYWSNESRSEHERSAAVETLRYVGCPDWLARTIITLRDVNLAIRRFLRGL